MGRRRRDGAVDVSNDELSEKDAKDVDGAGPVPWLGPRGPYHYLERDILNDKSDSSIVVAKFIARIEEFGRS